MLRHGWTRARATPRSASRRRSSAEASPAPSVISTVPGRPASARSWAIRAASGGICSAVWFIGIQPSPSSAARRRAAGPSPPMCSGGQGRWTGLGSNITGPKSKNSPWCSTTSSLHSRRQTPMASSTRRPRVAKSRPTASHSAWSQLAPMPNSTRPPETTSRVVTARATTKGWRRPMLYTWVPKWIRSVRPARKPR